MDGSSRDRYPSGHMVLKGGTESAGAGWLLSTSLSLSPPIHQHIILPICRGSQLDPPRDPHCPPRLLLQGGCISSSCSMYSGSSVQEQIPVGRKDTVVYLTLDAQNLT
ncbi:hypothetical protein Tco_1238936 [Tanacetum coccineum]